MGYHVSEILWETETVASVVDIYIFFIYLFLSDNLCIVFISQTPLSSEGFFFAVKVSRQFYTYNTYNLCYIASRPHCRRTHFAFIYAMLRLFIYLFCFFFSFVVYDVRTNSLNYLYLLYYFSSRFVNYMCLCRSYRYN